MGNRNSPRRWAAIGRCLERALLNKCLRFLCLLALLSQGGGFNAAASDEETVVTFERMGGLPIVSVRTFSRTWKFVLDTGSAICAASPEFALETAGTTNSDFKMGAIGLQGDPVAMNVVTCPYLKLGGKTFINVPVAVADLDMFRKGKSIQIDGLLGFAPFRDVYLTLDYQKSQLMLTPTNSPHQVHEPALPYELYYGMPCIDLLLQGLPARFVIDSGYEGSLGLTGADRNLDFKSPPRATTLLASIAGVSTNYKARLSRPVALAGTEVVEPIVSGISQNARSVGGELLEKFKVIFDPLRQQVEMIPNQPGPIRQPSVRGVGLSFRKASDPAEPWTVDFMMDDVPEAVKVIQQGDRCLKINGEPVSAWPWERYSKYLKTADVIHFTFVRGLKEFDVEARVYAVLP